MGAYGLIQRIKSRTIGDIINQGLRVGQTGGFSGATTDGVMIGGTTDRVLVVTGLLITASSATDILVSVGFKPSAGGNTTPFFTGYVMSGSALSMEYSTGDERYGNVGDSLVMTTSAGTVAFTANARIIAELDAVTASY